MLCENCGRKEANVRYSENINGRKKEMHLCEECSEKLGIGKMDFNMPIDFSSFFGGFMDEFMEPEIVPMLEPLKKLKCENCGYTFDDIANTGKLGCENCYDVFENRLDPIIKRIQGANRHVGRSGKVIDSKITQKTKDSKATEPKTAEPKLKKIKESKEPEVEDLQQQLKEAIKEERYEDAAKIRDEIAKRGK